MKLVMAGGTQERRSMLLMMRSGISAFLLGTGVLLCRLDSTCTLTNELSSSDSSQDAVSPLIPPANVDVTDLPPTWSSLSTFTVMASFTVASSSALVARCGTSVPRLTPSHSVAPSQRRVRRGHVKASIHDTGYAIADAVSKVADKADKAVGSVNAPGWVLPVSYVPCSADSIGSCLI